MQEVNFPIVVKKDYEYHYRGEWKKCSLYALFYADYDPILKCYPSVTIEGDGKTSGRHYVRRLFRDEEDIIKYQVSDSEIPDKVKEQIERWMAIVGQGGR